MDTHALLSERARRVDASGIRKIWDLAATVHDPINLSIGQPDFPVPAEIKLAAVRAIEADANGYTPTIGIPELREKTAAWLRRDLGWPVHASGGQADDPGLLITSGTSGGLMLAAMSLLGPGDEFVMGDPYFALYPHLGTITGARSVLCETAPDYRLTADRVEPLLTERTKFVLLNSPSNPCGTVLTSRECDELRELCARRGVLLISDEIYDEFTFSEARTEMAADAELGLRCPSPARRSGAWGDVLVIRGFGKTYGCTGWRLGYAAGPRPVIDAMMRLQQYTYVCAPSPLQSAAAAAFGVDLSPLVSVFEARRNAVVKAITPHARIVLPSGAFYGWIEVPPRLGMTASEFATRAVRSRVLVIPGQIFSRHDSHFRLSYAVADEKLREGLAILRGLLQDGSAIPSVGLAGREH